jgi:ArsR family transcriptional regulator, lead/cadmium/zinc/bismuth-responsive transcriptional repressor
MGKKNSILLFKALGEETKHRILRLLINGEICACKIPSIIEKNQSNTSMHLAKLQEWGLIKSRREGKKILYTIKDARINKILSIIK